MSPQKARGHSSGGSVIRQAKASPEVWHGSCPRTGRCWRSSGISLLYFMKISSVFALRALVGSRGDKKDHLP